jgi:hypothetical protein
MTHQDSEPRLRRNIRRPTLRSIDDDERMYNLATGYWVYDDFLRDLCKAGWVRFVPGFKAGVYGHPSSKYCTKPLGMGVGENPTYFCERGYYIAHERDMLTAFRNAGFSFAPSVLNQNDSISFLKEWGVRGFQAELQVQNDDLLVMEYIPGVAASNANRSAPGL